MRIETGTQGKVNGSYRGRSYIRYSDHKQDDGFSVEYQMHEIEEFCSRNGIDLYHSHIDQAQSGTKVAGREEFFRLIEAVKDGAVDVIVVYKLNRLFRNSYESQKYRKLFRKHGVKLMSVTQQIDEDTSSGRLTTNILSDIDQYQSETISDHVKSSMREMARQGYFTGGTVPYGYTLDVIKHGSKIRKKYVEDAEESQIVRDIFEFYADGHSLRHIQEYLQEKEIKTRRGKDFGLTTIARMLANDFYIGTLRYKTEGYDDVVIENAVPAIVPMSMWHAVQERKNADKLTQPRKAKSLYSLTGKIECALCGEHFFGMRSGSMQRGKYFEYQYYVCSKRKNYRTCSCRKVRKEQIENLLLKEIKNKVLNENDMARIAHEILSQLEDSPTIIANEIKKLEKEKKKLETSLETMLEMRLNGEMSPAVLTRKSAEVEERLSAVKSRLFTLTEQQRHSITFDSIMAHLQQLLSYADENNEDLLKLLFDNLVEKVVVSADCVDIFLRVYARPTLAYKQTYGHPHVALYSSIHE
jgi:site-specific DNA recombinase